MIDGVIHAAGILEDSPILTKTRESASRVLNRKVKGTLVLAELFRGKPLDFLRLSSISSLDPPAGQVDYAAAECISRRVRDERRNPIGRCNQLG